MMRCSAVHCWPLPHLSANAAEPSPAFEPHIPLTVIERRSLQPRLRVFASVECAGVKTKFTWLRRRNHRLRELRQTARLTIKDDPNSLPRRYAVTLFLAPPSQTSISAAAHGNQHWSCAMAKQQATYRHHRLPTGRQFQWEIDPRLPNHAPARQKRLAKKPLAVIASKDEIRISGQIKIRTSRWMSPHPPIHRFPGCSDLQKRWDLDHWA